MFDKQAQRLRAQQLTQSLAQQGLSAPKLSMPEIKNTGPRDLEGNLYAIGQKVVRPVKNGNTSTLRVCEVTHVAGSQVYLDGSRRGLGRPECCLIIGHTTKNS